MEVTKNWKVEKRIRNFADQKKAFKETININWKKMEGPNEKISILDGENSK